MTKTIGPQPGAQEKFLACTADIVIYGGAAGGGKSAGLLLEAARYSFVPGFSAVLFRQTYGDITNPGGLWESSEDFFNDLGGIPRKSNLEWRWRTKDAKGNKAKDAIVMMSHFQHEKYKLNWQGSQLAMIGWDELTHFSWEIFRYMLSRNRTICGVRPYIRCTCNPDPDHWVRDFIDWWIGPDGYPLPERDGVIRYMLRINDEVNWFDKPEDVPKDKGWDEEGNPLYKSVTFIAAKLSDNPILMKKDPGYLANLMAMPKHERDALLGGNWNIRVSAGIFFKEHWFEVIDEENAPIPDGTILRYWDRAATEPHEGNTDPDWTVGVKMYYSGDDVYVMDVERFRGRPAEVRQRIRSTASRDGIDCEVWLEKDPGQAGESDIDALTEYLHGYQVFSFKATKAKTIRAKPFSGFAEPPQVAARQAAAQAALGVTLSADVEDALRTRLTGRVYLYRADWNSAFTAELAAFPDGPHDDQVDAACGAFNQLMLYKANPAIYVLG